ncbi:MAG: F0F1 ATP synthase subunit delta [Melioribacteraceae bacterium]|nr:F0F1 ATP synthase subunit delta [Melioribacteraceae bacterium]
MSELNISTRYATALMNLADEKEKLDVISSDMDLIYNTLDLSKDLRSVLASPVIKEAIKSDILIEIFSSKVSAESLRFIKFVLSKNRQDYLYQIVKRYLELKDIKSGIVEVTITSAVELQDSQVTEIRKKLENITGKTMRFKFKIDESIIGGFLVKIGDTVMDASIEHQLDKLREKLKSEETVLN